MIESTSGISGQHLQDSVAGSVLYPKHKRDTPGAELGLM